MGHHSKFPTSHHRMLLRILGAWCKSSSNRTLSYKDAFQRIECEGVSKQPCVRGGCCICGRCSAWATVGNPRELCRESGRTGDNMGRGRRKNNGRTAVQRIVGCVWHHGGLEYRRARPWGSVKHKIKRSL